MAIAEPLVESKAISARLLVVEDVLEQVEGLIMRLRKQGWSIETTGNLKDANEKLADGEFELLLLDWRLPMNADAGFADQAAGRELFENVRRGVYQRNFGMELCVITTPGPHVDQQLLQSYRGFRGVYFKGDDVRPFLTKTQDVLERVRNPNGPRRLLRTLVSVESIRRDGRGRIAAVTVPAWNEAVVVPIRMDLFPPAIRTLIEHRDATFPVWLLAYADIAAETESELRLEAFQAAPELTDQEEF